MASMAPMSDNGLGGNPQSENNDGDKFNPKLAVMVVVLIVGVLVVANVLEWVRRCVRDGWATPRSSGDLQSESFNLKSCGLEKAQLDALPLVRRADLGPRDDYECPVCLMDFEPKENLRLLPSCEHVFHQDCIDLWFDSHSTCPLCRASLLGGGATHGVDQVAPRAPVDSIDEVSENGDSDAEVHDGMRWDASREDSRSSRGAMITREDEQSSASGALSRNSESFKRAARIVEADESAAAEAALESNSKLSTSVRWSSPLEADLVHLRSLLMGADENANSALGSSLWWSARARSLERLAAIRDPAAQSEFHSSREEWVTVDLEEGKATPELAEPSTSTSSQGESTKGKWSDWFGLSGLMSLKGIAFPSRSTSDAS